MNRKLGKEKRIANRVYVCAALLAVAGWACDATPAAESQVGDDTPTVNPDVENQLAKHEYRKDSILVKFKDAPTSKSAHQALKGLEVSIDDKNKDGVYDRFAHLANGRLAVVELDKSVSVEEALTALR